MALWTRIHHAGGRITRQDAYGIERRYWFFHRAIDALHTWWVNFEWRRRHPQAAIDSLEDQSDGTD